MKAILLIDMPDSCTKGNYYDGCPCVVTGWSSRPFCSVEKEECPEDGRPSWCPLKPMPEKYIEREIKIETERDVEVCTHGITLGRNLLIEELEK